MAFSRFNGRTAFESRCPEKCTQTETPGAKDAEIQGKRESCGIGVGEAHASTSKARDHGGMCSAHHGLRPRALERVIHDIHGQPSRVGRGTTARLL